MMDIAITKEFKKAWDDLPGSIYKKVGEFIEKLRTDPTSPGLHIEEIPNAGDAKIRSGRVNQAYRVILAMVMEGNISYLLLWVDHHDEAYQWANRRKLEVNPDSKTLQLYRVVDPIDTPITTKKIFDSYSADQLLALGLPEAMLSFVRSLTDKHQLSVHREDFPSDVYSALELLAEGESYSDVLSLFSQPSKEGDGTISSALRSGRSDGFKILDDNEELKKMLEAPLEKWRVFLHPDQKKLVDRDFSGPARVSGEAGTGKTVVAMHRTKYLLGKGNEVLFVTFTKNLVGDIEENLKTILSMSDIKRLEVESVDSVLYDFMKKNCPDKRIVYNEKELNQYWEAAIKNAGAYSLNLKPAFFKSEWELIATPMEELESIKYLSVNRKGRGVRLDREGRLKVWRVFEEYMALLEKDGKMDSSYAFYKARQILKKAGKGPYDSIVIDEGQDISVNAYKFLRRYAGEEHPNDLFIAGDSRQRIYKHKAVLSKCGINVVGRSSILRVNYRTTEETREFACKVLEGEDYEKNGEFASCRLTSSLTSGDKPLVKNFASFGEQMDFVKKEIQSLIESGAKLEDICLTARSNAEVSKTKSELKEMGIACTEIAANEGDDMNVPGIRVATMHRIKGLEFRYVFLLSVNEGTGYASLIEDGSEEEDNELIEKSLLYVALTRASIKAYVLSYEKPSKLLSKLMGE